MLKHCFQYTAPSFLRQRKTLFGLLTLLLCFAVEAQSKTARELWIAMPDSILPLLTSQQRADMVDADNLRLRVETTNVLGGKSQVDTLQADFLSARLSMASSLQLGVLPTHDGDSVVCLVHTYNGPKSESVVKLYSQSWQELQTLTFRRDDFTQRPDTMSADRYEELLQTLDPYFFSAELSVVDASITVTPHAVALGADEEKAVEAVFLQRKYNWDGRKFN